VLYVIVGIDVEALRRFLSSSVSTRTRRKRTSRSTRPLSSSEAAGWCRSFGGSPCHKGAAGLSPSSPDAEFLLSHEA
jgi:hypothetical protein